MIARRLRAIWKPEMYQGRKQMRDYFEGWYFKMVDKTSTHAYAIIPGISFGETLEDSHSFVQVLRGIDASTSYVNYRVDDFRASDNVFHLQIADNVFSLSEISVNLTEGEIPVRGTLHFEGIKGWPVKRLSPGAMGPFRFLPRMQCLHGILSFDHDITGSLLIDNEEIEFTGGRGYIEKDWGKEFPSAWIWMQSNHFSQQGISFTSSIATIPWMGSSFPGFLIGLLYDNKIYRFTTYTRAKVSNPEVSDKKVKFTVSDKKHILEVTAIRSGGGSLRSPIQGLMTGRIMESLESQIQLRFFRHRGNTRELIFEDEGQKAGLEVVGDMSAINAVEVES